jgi:hypothetical protein
MQEYAFVVRLHAVVRIRAKDERTARLVVAQIQGASKLKEDVSQWDEGWEAWEVTEFSVDDASPYLFEVDREDVE